MIEWDLIEKSFHELLNDKERKALNTWLNRSERNRTFYNNAMEGGPTDAMDGISIKVIAEKRDRFIRKVEASSQRRILRRRFIRTATAAAVVLPIILYYTIKLTSTDYNDAEIQNLIQNTINLEPGYSKAILKTDDGEQLILHDSLEFNGPTEVIDKEVIKINTLIIPRGGIFHITLSDGTKVWLNSESELQFPDRFTGSTREVSLRGEAFFDVAKDKSHQFIVHTENFDMNVYGTNFNVNTYDNEPSNSMTLIEGSVSVTIGNKTSFLVPNQQIVFDKASGNYVINSNVDVNVIQAWRNGIFYFDKEPLESIMRKISRWYGIDYQIKDDHILSQTRFSGKIEMYENGSKVLDMLKLTNEIDYSFDNSTLIIKPAR